MNTLKVAALMACAALAASCSSTPKSAPAAQLQSVAGTWTVAIQTPMGPRDSTLLLTQNGTQLAGTMQTPRGESAVVGVLHGNEIAFNMKLNAQGMDMTIDYAGTVTNDSMTGKVVLGQFGEGNWTAKRKK
jgi:hypothetical protein